MEGANNYDEKKVHKALNQLKKEDKVPVLFDES